MLIAGVHPPPALGSVGSTVLLDAFAGCATAFATFVARNRSRGRDSTADQILLLALGFWVAIELLLLTFSAIAAAPSGALAGALGVAMPVVAGVLAVASLVPRNPAPLEGRRSRQLTAGAAVCAATILAGAVAGSLWPRWWPGVLGTIEPASVGGRAVALVPIDGLAAILFAVAAVGFAKRASPRMDDLEGWLALSAGLAAAAQLVVLLVPAHEFSFSIGDLVSAVSMVALAYGAGREFRNSRRRQYADVIRTERRRLARELHDSVATELAFILGRSRELAGLYPQERAFIDIASAATHALDGSRTAIRGLRAASSGNLTLAVQTRARELARRAGLQLTLDVPEQIEASAEVEHAVLSIVQEAIANASRHADAERLELSLRAHGDTILVRISDDGSGFDSVAIAPPRPGHLGLSSMQERAQILGGDLRLQSVRGHGTTIELELS